MRGAGNKRIWPQRPPQWGSQPRISLRQLFRNKSAVRRKANLKPALRTENRAPHPQVGARGPPQEPAPAWLRLASPVHFVQGPSWRGSMKKPVTATCCHHRRPGRGAKAPRGRPQTCPSVPGKGELGYRTGTSRQGFSKPRTQRSEWVSASSPQAAHERRAQRTHILRMDPQGSLPPPCTSPGKPAPLPRTAVCPLSLLTEPRVWYFCFTHTELYDLQSFPMGN